MAAVKPGLLDRIVEPLVLKHGAPFKPMDWSRTGIGTRAQTQQTDGFERNRPSAPFEVKGEAQWDEYPGAIMQEVEEGDVQQWYLILFGAAGLILGCIAAAVTLYLTGLLYGLIVVPSFVIAAGYFASGYQTPRSEDVSHAVEWWCLEKLGVPRERLIECCVSNMHGYDWYGSAFTSRSDDEITASLLALQPYAEAYMARPEAALAFQAAVARQQATPKPQDDS